MFRTALAALILSAPVALADGVALPMGFDGLYSAEFMTCADPGRITVQNGTLDYEDELLTITDLIEFPGQPNKIGVEMVGEEGVASATITLSETELGKALFVDYSDGSSSIFDRCEDLP
jgi:hypothetical protein